MWTFCCLGPKTLKTSPHCFTCPLFLLTLNLFQNIENFPKSESYIASPIHSWTLNHLLAIDWPSSCRNPCCIVSICIRSHRSPLHEWSAWSHRSCISRTYTTEMRPKTTQTFSPCNTATPRKTREKTSLGLGLLPAPPRTYARLGLGRPQHPRAHAHAGPHAWMHPLCWLQAVMACKPADCMGFQHFFLFPVFVCAGFLLDPLSPILGFFGG